MDHIRPGAVDEQGHVYKYACTGKGYGDQFLLNGWYRNKWTRLEDHWNSGYTYHGKPTKVKRDENVHFTGINKPPVHLCDWNVFH